MEDFNKYLARLTSGDMTLVDEIGSMQLVKILIKIIHIFVTHIFAFFYYKSGNSSGNQ